MRNHKLRIAFVSEWDADNETAMSGASYYMRRALKEAGNEIVDVFPASHSARAKAALLKGFPRLILSRLKGLYYSPKRTPAYASALAAYAMDKIKESGKIDFIFSQSALSIAALKVDIPILMTADQPFDTYVSEYIHNPSPLFVSNGKYIEKIIARNARYVVFPSKWACDAFIKTHPESASKAHLIEWGANLPSDPDRVEVNKNIGIKSRAPILSLLFIGRDWERKGGAIVLEVFHHLAKMGLNVRLDIVGCTPAILDDKIKITPFIDKMTEGGWLHYKQLMNDAHFFLMPSRAEAYGHVLCESAAFGVPSVSRMVGGISTIIEDGQTGICLPLAAPAELFAQRIAEVFTNKKAYVAMSENALSAYQTRLSWQAFASTATKLMTSVV